MDSEGLGSIFGQQGAAAGTTGATGAATGNPYIMAASAGIQLYQASQTKKNEVERIKLQSEMAKNKAAGQALSAAQSFRQNLSAQLATSALRSSGGGSIATQFLTASMSSMFEDEAAYKQQQSYLELAEDSALLNVKLASKAKMTSMATGAITKSIPSGNSSTGAIGTGGGAPAGSPGLSILGAK